MDKKIFFALIGILIFSSYASAQAIQYPNGGFETGVLSPWVAGGIPPNYYCLSPYQGFQYAQVDSNLGISGSYSFHVNTSSTATQNRCFRLQNADKNIFTGDVNFLVDMNSDFVSGNSAFAFFFRGVPNNDVNTTCTISFPPSNGTVGCRTPGNLTSQEYYVEFLFSCAGSSSQCSSKNAYFDNFRYLQIPKLVHNVEEERDPFPVDVNFSITNDLRLDTNNMIVPNSTCTITFGGVSSTFPFNSTIQKYEKTYIRSLPGVVSYSIGCSGPSGYNNPDANVTGTVTFVVDLSEPGRLDVVDIENVSHDINASQVDFFPSNQSGQIVYSIQNNYTSSLDIPQVIHNSLRDGRQYFVYTATQAQYDAGIWVFNDSLTFGNTFHDPVQKIWVGTEHEYTFTDTLFSGQKKFYKLTYDNPYKSYESILGSNDWAVTLEPDQVDINSHTTDVYQISVYSNIRNTFIQNIPDVNSNTDDFEVQFTAYASSSANVFVGQTIFGSDIVPNFDSITTTPTRFSFPVSGSNFESQILMKTNSSTPITVYIYDYAIVAKSYFTKRLELMKSNGDSLDLFLVNNQSKQYVAEGKDFRARTQAYDREGLLNQLTFRGYFANAVLDANLVSISIEALDGDGENLFEFDEIVPGIVDLNGTAVSPTIPRDFLLTATLLDDSGRAVAIQSKVVKFVQYPYFPDDIQMIFFPTEKRKGKKPSGVLQANFSEPETLIGYDIRIWDSNSGTTINNPIYQNVIYRGSDFECIGQNCGLQLTVEDYIFQNTGQTFIAITAILNTENFNLNNPLTQSIRSFYVTTVQFDVAKIHQLNERTDRTYRNTEEIPLVLVLRDTDATDISDKINVYITISNCSDSTPSDGPCVPQTTRFEQTGHQYDERSNLNYFFFRHLWYLDNGSLLPDGNFIAFHAHVSDSEGVATPIVPVLADKCAVNGTDFWSNALASIINGLGCATPQADIVVQGDVQERALDIDNTRVTTAPSQELFACINTDTNNVIGEPLEANLYCFVWYQVAEKPIDSFRLRITNQYSDLSDTGSDKQYAEFLIPYELIAINDLPLLKQELETNQGTSINTVGEFIQAGLADIAVGGLRNLGIESIIDGSGIITNIGADANFNQAFDPSTVGGFAWYVIKGLPVVNAQDFKNHSAVRDDFDVIERTEFLNYLSENGVSYSANDAELQLIINSFSVPERIFDQNGHLLIDEVATDQPINQQNADVNTPQPYQYVPSILYFTLQNTMFFENHSGSDTRSLVIRITTEIDGNLLSGLNDFIGDLLKNPVSAIINWMFSNIGLLTIIVLGTFLVSKIYQNFKNANGG